MKHAFIGYGSLLDHNSLSKTIADRKFIPVIIKKYQRIFNLKDEDDSDPDVLNAIPSPTHYFNAVMFYVNNEELIKLKRREEDYNLVEADVYDFNNKNKKIGRAFLSIDEVVGLDKQNKKPDRDYFIACREAAYRVSPEFGKIWDKTTYTAGGKKITSWLRNNPDYNTIK